MPQLWTENDEPFVARIRAAASQVVEAFRERAYSKIWFELMDATGRVTTASYAAQGIVEKGDAMTPPEGDDFGSWVSVMLQTDHSGSRTAFFEGIRSGMESIGVFVDNRPHEVFPCRGGYLVVYQTDQRPHKFPVPLLDTPRYHLDMETYLVGSGVMAVEPPLTQGLELLGQRRFAEAVAVLQGAANLARAHHILQEPAWQNLFNEGRRQTLVRDSQLVPMARARLGHATQLLSLSLQAPIPENLRTTISIFVSHASADNEFSQRLASALTDLGLRVWYDDWEIQVGDSITDKVNEGLSEHDYLCVVLSEKSVSSEWVRREINAAFIRGINEKRAVLLPIRIDNCEVPPLMADIKTADFRSDFFVGLSQLVDSIVSQA